LIKLQIDLELYALMKFVQFEPFQKREIEWLQLSRNDESERDINKF